MVSFKKKSIKCDLFVLDVHNLDDPKGPNYKVYKYMLVILDILLNQFSFHKFYFK